MADEKIPYEQAREELVEVVRRLEAGGTSLEESLALWERGEELAATCQRWLDGARERPHAHRGPCNRGPDRYFFGTNLNAAEFMQYRKPVGGGPSSKT